MGRKARSRKERSREAPAPVAARSGVEYTALEGWRGVCACLVALFHFRDVLRVPVNSNVLASPVIQHAYLFVDFFFVLSGFVIASRYQDSISAGRTRVTDFLALRLGRLYPLHLFTLFLIMLIFTYVGSSADSAIALHIAPADTRPWSFLANIFMLQGLHTTPVPTWNHPSWSVSTEFASYVVYALLWKNLKQWTWFATTFIIVAAPIAIAMLVGHMDTTFDWGILRSLLGFALGAAMFNLLRSPAAQSIAARIRWNAATVIEIVMLAVIGGFVALPDHTKLTIAAPFVFALGVLVFSGGYGAVSGLLSSRVFRHVGTVSYSVYMLHQPMQELFMCGAVWSYAKLGWVWMLAVDPTTNKIRLGASIPVGEALTAAMLILLLGASTLTWRFVETPCRSWVRTRVDRARKDRVQHARLASSR